MCFTVPFLITRIYKYNSYTIRRGFAFLNKIPCFDLCNPTNVQKIKKIL